MEQTKEFSSYFTDLHIHIGRTKSGKPVKITGSRTLTLPNIISYAKEVKGIQLIGVIDCHVPEVLCEIEGWIKEGIAYEHENGGVRIGDLCLILGTEIEIYDEECSGPIHVLAYLPDIQTMKKWTNWMSGRMKNITLSSQRIYETGKNVQRKIRELGGLFIPAHVFTPFKSLYGKGVKYSLSEVFNAQYIDAIELGLSADTSMANTISELRSYSFITNSDAHSLEKIGREYQTIRLKDLSFKELVMALHQKDGRKITGNYGLNPKLGKYFESVCSSCLVSWPKETVFCIACKQGKRITGVSERIKELGNASSYQDRPPYVHQVPLEFIPKLGKKTLEKLRDLYGTDMSIIHCVPIEDLEKNVHPGIASVISGARKGTLRFSSGGGGTYGKVDHTL